MRIDVESRIGESGMINDKQLDGGSYENEEAWGWMFFMMWINGAVLVAMEAFPCLPCYVSGCFITKKRSLRPFHCQSGGVPSNEPHYG
jgi:hypothetical protein